MLKHADCLLVVGEQASLRAAIAQLLLPLGYRIEIASNEKRARQLICQGQFAGAIVAPLSLAGLETAFLRELQAAVPKLAILIENATDAKRFASSFPDVMVCGSAPLEHEKLLAFLSNPVTETSDPAGEPEILHFAGCVLDVSGRIFLNAKQQEVALTRGEFALLAAFAQNCGRVLSRNQLRHAMDGGNAESFDRAIDMLVARLRRKIETNPSQPRLIVTMPGVGYKFAPQVHRARPEPFASSDRLHAAGSRAAPRAERRQITVVCCQIIGFAALAARLDPEDLDGAISPVYAACAEVIDRFGGTLVRTIGDTMLAYFGYPTAIENDAVRAVRAALDMLRAVRAIHVAAVGNFRARVGVATGLMLVGGLSSLAGRDAVGIGEALNLALHLQKAAAAETVMVAGSTRRLIGGFFRCQEVAPFLFEDGSEPTQAWHVIAEVSGMPRFEALRCGGMLEFVGREAELERLRQCWSKAVGGSGQVTLLEGEAGIGKSRVALELQARLGDELHTVVRFSGSQHRADASMSVLIEELQSAAGFAVGEDVNCKVEKLRGQFAALGPGAAEATALGAMLLGLPLDTSTQLSHLSAQKRKDRTFAALLARLEAIAARQPVLAVLEDAHWVDPTSLEFFALLVERASHMSLLLVIAARPEFSPPWPHYSHVTTLALSRLSPADSVLLIYYAAGSHRLPAALEADIIARADGVPLYVEELTRSLVESGADGSNGSGTAVPQLPGTAPIPSTLHGLLLARLDRLGRGKDAAQTAAVIGREFPFEVLRLTMGVDETTLLGALDQLVSSGLAFRRGTPPQATYTFKHALVRDAAYDLLVRERRQELHAAVARVYEEHFPDIAEAPPELLAHHHIKAGNAKKAVRYLAAASRQARFHDANSEAIKHLKTAIQLLLTLPEDTERDEMELDLQISLGATYTEAKGFGAPEVEAAYARGWALSQTLTDTGRLLAAVRGLWIFHLAQADWPRTLRLADQLLALSQSQSDTSFQVEAHRAQGVTLLWLGDPASAREHLERGRLLYNRKDHEAHVLRYGSDAGVASLAHEAYALWVLGYADQALTLSDQAVALARELQHPFSLAQALLYRSFLHQHRREPELAKAYAEEANLLAAQHEFPFWRSEATIVIGWATAQSGAVPEGLRQARQGFERFVATGARMDGPRWLGTLAEIYGIDGQNDEALQTISSALTAIYATGERFYESPLFCLKGALLLRRGPANGGDAESSLRKSIEVARAQKARGWELQAVTRLARMLNERCHRQQARDELARSYEWFKEGLETPDLKEAAKLLSELE